MKEAFKKIRNVFGIICLFHQFMFAATDVRIFDIRLVELKMLTTQYYTFNRVFLILFEFSEYGLK
jgi:hypothetical protein